MSEAEQILGEKLQYSDYIGVENLILPWGQEINPKNQDLGSLELLVDVYFDKHFSANSIFTEMNHTDLVELVKTSVREGQALKFDLLAEKIAWDLDKLTGGVAFFLKLIWRNKEENQADWRISFWRVSQTIAAGNPELVEFVVVNPNPMESENSSTEKPHNFGIQSFPGNRRQAEATALSEIPRTPLKAVLALGGNLGDVRQTFHNVIADLRNNIGIGISEISPLIRTKPVLMEGQEPQPDYLNVVLIIRCSLSARQLLALTQEIELKYGRERKEKWGARTLDIDIITYGSLYSSIPELQLPHPRAHQRAFVLLPWSMVEESAVIPGQGEVVVLMNYASDINGILEIDAEWFTEKPISNTDNEKTPLPAWNNLSDATQDIRIVDLYDENEEAAEISLSQSPIIDAKSDKTIIEHGGTQEEIDNADYYMPAAEEAGDSDLEEESEEFRQTLTTEESLIPESSLSFWGRFKRLFKGEDQESEDKTMVSSSAEEFFAVIEKDNAIKEQEVLKGKNFSDVVAEITSQESSKTEKTELPPDTGEIPIQKMREAADKAQQQGLRRRSVLRPSSIGPIPIDDKKDSSVESE